MKRAVLHVVLPVAIGAGIYLTWRSPTLLVFHWTHACGLSAAVVAWRQLMTPWLPPDWVLFSLPNALWTYALASMMAIVWRSGRPNPAGYAWIGTGALLGCGSEVGQAFGVIQGTFDPYDLLFSATAAFVATWRFRCSDIS